MPNGQQWWNLILPVREVSVAQPIEIAKHSRSGSFQLFCAAVCDIYPIGKMKQVQSVIEIGQAIRAARQAAGLRQDDLAGLAGVGPRFLIELEAGKPTVRIDKLLAVLATLGIDLHIDGMPE